MKKGIIAFCALLLINSTLNAQNSGKEITSKNSWLKLGAQAGIPVGNVSDFSNFTLGLQAKGQFMDKTYLGIGIATGYTHYFPKSGLDGFGTIPLGLFVNYYPKTSGLYVGGDIGYSFITKSGADGGVYFKPQLGYHNYNWNFYTYYNHIARSDSKGGSIADFGIGAVYNLRFN